MLYNASGAGRGVFAGVDYRDDDLVAADAAIMIYDKDTRGTMMRNYLYMSTDQRAFVSMGYGSLFNHHTPHVVDNIWRNGAPSEDRRDKSFFLSHVDYYSDRPIKAGEEIFNSYGDEKWFTNRHVDYISGKKEELGDVSLSRSLEDLQANGHCLSDVSVHKSEVPGVGYGLYAERSFQAGEVVSISPVLFLSKIVLADAGPGSLLLNYAISVPDSDIALLPVGDAAMVNNGGKFSSLEMNWYDWETRQVLKGSDILDIMEEWSVDDLESSAFASLDICYVATRYIEQGEELTLYYGKEWARAYRDYKKKLKEDPKREILFRQPIGARLDMFPDWWMVDCVGKACDYAEDDESAPDHSHVNIRTDCELFMAPSTINEVGRGLFAGVNFVKNTAFDHAPAITFPFNLSTSTQLINFAFSSINEAYIMAVLGPAMMLNHAEIWENTKYVYATKLKDIVDPAGPIQSPQTTYSSLFFTVTDDVAAGDELFTNYGGEEWFDIRGIPFDGSVDGLDVEDRSRDIAELSSLGHCLTDIGVYESDIPSAGEGVFAERDFKAGDVVSISPVLVLPKHILNSTSNSVMINYVLSVPGSDVTLLPLGRAAMVNNGGKEASLEVHWYDWDAHRPLYDDKMPSIMLERNIDELEASSFALLDLSYVATRDIEKGEELSIFYGVEWEAAWKEYQSALWRRKQLLHAAGDVPLFKHPIGVKPEMFPSSWMVDCIGETCGRPTRSCDLYMATSTIPGIAQYLLPLPLINNFAA